VFPGARKERARTRRLATAPRAEQRENDREWDGAVAIIHRKKSCKLCIDVQAMKNRFAALLLFPFVLAASSCSRAPKRTFPLVQNIPPRREICSISGPATDNLSCLSAARRWRWRLAPEPDIEAYSYDDQITVSRAQGNMLQNTTFLEKIGAPTSHAMTADGRTLAGGDANGAVTLWDLGSGNLTLHLDVPGPILCLAFSRDGNWLANRPRQAGWRTRGHSVAL